MTTYCTTGFMPRSMSPLASDAKSKLSPAQQKEAREMLKGGRSQVEVAKLFNVHRSTICRLAAEGRVLAR